MHANPTGSYRQRWLACAVAMTLGSALLQPAATAHASSAVFPLVHLELSAAVSGAPGIEGRVHRMVTRAERTLGRLAGVVNTAAATWLWILASVTLFLLIVAVASATDLRMLDLRRQRPQGLARDLVDGVLIFFRVLRDRHTPHLARFVLVLALLYWVLPVDLVGSGIPVVSILDELVVAILAAKAFIHLCPDAVVAAHAAAVRAGS